MKRSKTDGSNDHIGAADGSAPFFDIKDCPTVGRLEPGAMVGRYRIVGEIGSGGMGIVYEAVREDLQRPVALKTLLASARTGSADRLRREAETLARLDHHGIAAVIDAFTEGDRFWIVMELVNGRPITESSSGRSVRGALRLFLEVCRAVDHAHLRGVVHRDLKPANILVDADDRPIVLDFGLARLVEEGADERVTQTGQFVGTLAYMSPEQTTGQDAAIDVRSDVYSLGVVLYEMLTRALPIEVPTGSLVRAARAIEHAQPIVPSRHNVALRGDIDQILLKTLEKSPSRRYESAGALAQDIERHLEHRPIEARPPTPLYRASRYVRRHRALVFGAGATIFALLIGLVIATTQVIRARDAEQRAMARFNDVRELANTVIFDLHDAIKDLPGGTAARAVLVERAQEFLNRLDEDASTDSAFRLELAESYVRLGDALGGYFGSNLMMFQQGHDAYSRAVTILESINDQGRLDIEGRRLLRDALRGLRQAKPLAIEDATDSPFGTISKITKNYWETSSHILESTEASEDDIAAQCILLTHLALDLEWYGAELQDILRAFDAAEATLAQLSATERNSIAALSAEGDMRQRRATILLRFGDIAAAATQFCLSEKAFRKARELAPHDRYIARMFGLTMVEGSIAFGQLGDVQAEAMANEGLQVVREVSEADPSDRHALRNLEVSTCMTGIGLFHLAESHTAATQMQRQAWLEEARRRFSEGVRLITEREANGELPDWESHYPAEMQAWVQRADEALAGLSSPAP